MPSCDVTINRGLHYAMLLLIGLHHVMLLLIGLHHVLIGLHHVMLLLIGLHHELLLLIVRVTINRFCYLSGSTFTSTLGPSVGGA